MNYKNCELCGNKTINLGQYCPSCNEDVLEKLRVDNKKLREALIDEIENESTMSLEEINDYIDTQVLEVSE